MFQWVANRSDSEGLLICNWKGRLWLMCKGWKGLYKVVPRVERLNHWSICSPYFMSYIFGFRSVPISNLYHYPLHPVLIQSAILLLVFFFFFYIAAGICFGFLCLNVIYHPINHNIRVLSWSYAKFTYRGLGFESSKMMSINYIDGKCSNLIC